MPIRKVIANISELIKGADKLVLSADATAAVSTLTVRNILGAAINQIFMIGEPGSETTEIINTHASTAPSGTTVTLASALVQSHPAGTTVYIIKANQVAFYRAASQVDANSDASTLSLLGTQSIDPSSIENHYDDQTYTSGYYYYRFIDSVNSVNGIYSDGIPWGLVAPKFARNQVGFIFEFVRRKIGFEWGDKFSKDDAINELNDCLSYMDDQQLHWPNHLVSQSALAQLTRGVFEITMPSDIYDNSSRRSILNIKIGGQALNLVYKDQKEFEDLMSDAVYTTIRTQPSVGATSLNIVNSEDFASSGTVNVFTSNTENDITYTGITRSATLGALTGVPASSTGSITATHAVGTNVWQNIIQGQPLYFSVIPGSTAGSSGKIRIWPLPDSTWVNHNLFIDYWRVVNVVDSESDIIDVERYNLIKHWLLWKAKSYVRNNGKDDLTDPDWLEFKDRLANAIKIKPAGQKFKWKPKINQILYGSRRDDSPKEW